MYEKFLKLFTLTQEQLLKMMKKFLQQKYDKIITKKDYIVAIGDLPIGLVAHADTVFSIPPSLSDILYDKEKQILCAPATGLGADDRAGIWAIVELLNRGYRPTVIITTNEEKGCLGAIALSADKSICGKLRKRLKFLIEIDRRGNKDCVFYDCNNLQFKNYIQSFGLELNIGTFSDISVLAPICDCACVNISSAYYGEHTYAEYLKINELYHIIDTIEQILMDYKNASYFAFQTNDPKDKYMFCSTCNCPSLEEQTFLVRLANGKIDAVCSNCITELTLDWCDKCNLIFEKSKENQQICSFCEKENK